MLKKIKLLPLITVLGIPLHISNFNVFVMPSINNYFNKQASLKKFDHIIENEAGSPDMRQEIDATVAIINSTMAARKKDEPVIIIIGEAHNHIAHKYFERMLAEKLKNKNITHTMESDHTDWFGNDLSLSFSNYAPLSHKKVLENTSPFFNDASRKECRDTKNSVVPCIDEKEGFTKEAIKKINPELLGADISVVSPEGMAIRNEFMAARGMIYTNKYNPYIMQITGGAHVLGDKKQNFNYTQSLSRAYLNNQASHVISVVLDGEGLPLIPQDFKKEQNVTTVLVTGLPENTSEFDPKNGIPLKKVIEAEQKVIDWLDSANKPRKKTRTAQNTL
jgi:hypothetical protein